MLNPPGGGDPPLQHICFSGPNPLPDPPRNSREGRREGKKGREDRKGRRGGKEVQGREVRKTEKEDSVQHADIPATQGRRIAIVSILGSILVVILVLELRKAQM